MNVLARGVKAPYALSRSVPSPSREPFLTGTIAKRRIQTVIPPGQMDAHIGVYLSFQQFVRHTIR
jgi:hypothetical protein